MYRLDLMEALLSGWMEAWQMTASIQKVLEDKHYDEIIIFWRIRT